MYVNSNGFNTVQKLLTLVFFLCQAWFTLSRNINSQVTHSGVTKICMQFIKLLYLSPVHSG